MTFYSGALGRINNPMLVGTTAGAAKSTGVTTTSTWRYATDDAAATVETAGYFNNARSQLQVGDVIQATMAMGGTPVLKHYVVTAVPASGNVTVALQTTTAG